MHPSGLGSAMGLYVAGNSLGGVGGRLLTAAVADATSWRGGMAVVALASVVVTVAFWRMLPEPVALDEDDPADRATGGRLRSNPGVWALAAIPFLLMGGFVAVYNYLGYRLLDEPFSLPLAVAGLVFLAYLAGSLSSAVAGRLADSMGRPRVLVAAVLVMAAGLALTVPDRLTLVIVGLVVFTTGVLRRPRGRQRLDAGASRRPYRTRGSALLRLRLLRRLQRVRRACSGWPGRTPAGPASRPGSAH